MLLIIMGKTCSGKDTVAKEVEKRFGMKRIVTYTTRPQRTNEKNGDTYFFVSDKEFDEKVKNGFFLEHKTYATHFGTWKYGSPKEEVLKADNNIIILTPDGVRDFIKENTGLDYKIIYLFANHSTIEKRLRKRGENTNESRRRIRADLQDFVGAEMLADRIVYNNDDDNLNDVIAKIGCVIKKGGANGN